MKAMLDPERDLAGATPETLARALFRRTEPLLGAGGKPVVRDEPAVSESPTNEAPENVSHLVKGV